MGTIIGSQHDIIVITISYNTSNEQRGRTGKLIMSCERGEITITKENSKLLVVKESSDL